MRITDKHGTHGFYDVSRYPPSHPRPHCAFPWLLDKLRWTKAIVTAVSHFLAQNRVRILRTGQHNPTKNFQEYPPPPPHSPETWSPVASLPVSISTVNSPGWDSRFWTVSPGLQIRAWNLPDNRQSLPFLVDSTLWQWTFKYFALFELFC